MGNIIREAVSGIAGVFASGFDTLLQEFGDPNRLSLKAKDQPAWDDAPGGIVAYGECPQITGHTGDKSILAKVNLADDTEDVVLFECAAMQLKCVAAMGGWRAAVVVFTPGATTTLPSSSLLDTDTIYQLAATFELATGDIILYVDAVEANTVGGTDNAGTITALPIWRVGAPRGSWITDCAIFDRVLDVTELPGYVEPPTVTINKGSGQADPTYGGSVIFDVVFSEAVTGFATGDVTLSGTAGATTAVVSGTGSTYTVTVTGMTGTGTVIADIGVGVCTAVATGKPNAASTSTDNSVAWTEPLDPSTDIANLQIWIEGSSFTTPSGNVVITNLGTSGGSFGRIAAGLTFVVAGTAINGHATFAANGTVYSWSGSRWLSDDIYDIYVVAKGAAQANASLVAQHKGDATTGRTLWGTADDGTGGKARTFFNNGTSRTGLTSGAVFDNAPHVYRFHSTGGGDHYIQVDGGTDQLVITGQQVTPLNTPLRLFGVGEGAGGGVAASMFNGTVGEIFGCTSVQANNADIVTYLRNKWGI